MSKLGARRALLLRLIHVGKRELQLDDGAYRALLAAATGGLTSSAEMSEAQLQAVLDRLKRSGFAVRAGGDKPRRLDRSPEARKVRALWLFLHQLGTVRDPGEAALAKYCKRIAGVDDLHWASAQQMTRLTETLKKWVLREGLPQAIAALARELAAQPDAQADDLKSSALSQAACLRRQPPPGYDAHWAAWCALNQALGRSAAIEALAE